MPWSHKLKPPITLKDDRTLVTLKDAADVLLSLPESHQSRPTWLYAAQLLKDAAEGKRSAVAEIGLQLHRALAQSRMLAALSDESQRLDD